MKRRALNTEVTNIIDNRGSNVKQDITIQVLGPGTLFISTQLNDLQQLDITGAPINGLRLTQVSPIQDGKFLGFVGTLYMRADQGVDVEITINNSFDSVVQAGIPKKPRSVIPWNAPQFRWF